LWYWIGAYTSLRDVDDDVRTVAASALTPVTDILASGLSHQELCSVVDTLWDCLAEGGDDLGSSIGAVMDLLGTFTTVWRHRADNQVQCLPTHQSWQS
jgi:hypothetical protein